MKVVGCQLYAQAAFTPWINLVLIFRGHMELSDATEKTPAIPGIDPGTFRHVAQCLNRYATPGPHLKLSNIEYLIVELQLFIAIDSGASF
jgi:hypothetical protein